MRDCCDRCGRWEDSENMREDPITGQRVCVHCVCADVTEYDQDLGLWDDEDIQ